MIVKKLMGSVGWADYGDTADGEIHRVILRENGELVVDLTCEGYRYSASLKKVAGSQYKGQWTCLADRKTYKDDVSCTLYRSDEGYLLFGKWREDGANQYWWAVLSEVDHFPDETHA